MSEQRKKELGPVYLAFAVSTIIGLNLGKGGCVRALLASGPAGWMAAGNACAHPAITPTHPLCSSAAPVSAALLQVISATVHP